MLLVLVMVTDPLEFLSQTFTSTVQRSPFLLDSINTIHTVSPSKQRNRQTSAVTSESAASSTPLEDRCTTYTFNASSEHVSFLPQTQRRWTSKRTVDVLLLVITGPLEFPFPNIHVNSSLVLHLLLDPSIHHTFHHQNRGKTDRLTLNQQPVLLH